MHSLSDFPEQYQATPPFHQLFLMALYLAASNILVAYLRLEIIIIYITDYWINRLVYIMSKNSQKQW